MQVTDTLMHVNGALVGPQRSPQRAEQPHQEGPEAAPEVSSASTTPPREDSPARECSPARENSPARGSPPARDSTNDPPVISTADLSIEEKARKNPLLWSQVAAGSGV